jgi:hypothetical protein
MHMTDIDIAGWLATLDTQRPSPDGPLTPATLIERYCDPRRCRGLVADPGEHRADAHTEHVGFIGWLGGDHGYDDGYSYLEALESSGWVEIRETGNLPYVIAMVWPARTSDPRWCLAHYCEGDFTVAVYPGRDQTAIALLALIAEHRAR